jgi:hypothetical protein
MLDVQSFRAAGCEIGRYLVVPKVRERLAMNKQRSHRFNMGKVKMKEEIRRRLNSGNACYHSVNPLSSRLLSKNVNIKIYNNFVCDSVQL